MSRRSEHPPPDSADAATPAPIFHAELWPHRSLSRSGFFWLFGLTSIGLAIPLLALVGQPAFWVVGAFCLLDLALLLGLVLMTYRSGRLREVVSVWPDRLEIARVEPNGRRREWRANPHWVRVSLHRTKRVDDYLVLSSSGRNVELGAFLTAPERRALAEALTSALAEAKTQAASVR